MKKLFLLTFIPVALATGVRAQNNWQKTDQGLQYRLFTHNAGARLKQGDILTVNLIEKTERDSVIRSTYALGSPILLPLQPARNPADLMGVLPLMTVKDSAAVRVPADSVYAGQDAYRPASLGPGSYEIFIIKVERTQTMAEVQAEKMAFMDKLRNNEVVEADKYIAANKLNVRATPSGLKYAFTKVAPQGIKPLTGDTLLVNYTGKLLSGKVFDSSVESVARQAGLEQPGRTYEPFKFVVGAGQVIPGWDEGLLLLTQGSKATFIVPSKLAYGDQGAGNDIPPFSTLVFDIELLKVIKVKHKPAAAGTKAAVGKSYIKKKTVQKKS